MLSPPYVQRLAGPWKNVTPRERARERTGNRELGEINDQVALAAPAMTPEHKADLVPLTITNDGATPLKIAPWDLSVDDHDACMPKPESSRFIS